MFRKNIEDLEKKQILRPLDPLTANIFDFREGVDNPEVEDDVATPPEGRAEGEFLTVLEVQSPPPSFCALESHFFVFLA